VLLFFKKKRTLHNTAVVSEQTGVESGICTSVNGLTKCDCLVFGCQSAFGSEGIILGQNVLKSNSVDGRSLGPHETFSFCGDELTLFC